MVIQIQEFKKLPIINLGTIQEMQDDAVSEFQEIKHFYKHVQEANQEILDEFDDGEDSEDIVDQVFNYYEACKID
jgi:hypothetical protein